MSRISDMMDDWYIKTTSPRFKSVWFFICELLDKCFTPYFVWRCHVGALKFSKNFKYLVRNSFFFLNKIVEWEIIFSWCTMKFSEVTNKKYCSQWGESTNWAFGCKKVHLVQNKKKITFLVSLTATLYWNWTCWNWIII